MDDLDILVNQNLSSDSDSIGDVDFDNLDDHLIELSSDEDELDTNISKEFKSEAISEIEDVTSDFTLEHQVESDSKSITQSSEHSPKVLKFCTDEVELASTMHGIDVNCEPLLWERNFEEAEANFYRKITRPLPTPLSSYLKQTGFSILQNQSNPSAPSHLLSCPAISVQTTQSSSIRTAVQPYALPTAVASTTISLPGTLRPSRVIIVGTSGGGVVVMELLPPPASSSTINSNTAASDKEPTPGMRYVFRAAGESGSSNLLGPTILIACEPLHVPSQPPQGNHITPFSKLKMAANGIDLPPRTIVPVAPSSPVPSDGSSHLGQTSLKMLTSLMGRADEDCSYSGTQHSTSASTSTKNLFSNAFSKAANALTYAANPSLSANPSANGYTAITPPPVQAAVTFHAILTAHRSGHLSLWLLRAPPGCAEGWTIQFVCSVLHHPSAPANSKGDMDTQGGIAPAITSIALKRTNQYVKAGALSGLIGMVGYARGQLCLVVPEKGGLNSYGSHFNYQMIVTPITCLPHNVAVSSIAFLEPAITPNTTSANWDSANLCAVTGQGSLLVLSHVVPGNSPPKIVTLQKLPFTSVDIETFDEENIPPLLPPPFVTWVRQSGVEKEDERLAGDESAIVVVRLVVSVGGELYIYGLRENSGAALDDASAVVKERTIKLDVPSMHDVDNHQNTIKHNNENKRSVVYRKYVHGMLSIRNDIILVATLTFPQYISSQTSTTINLPNDQSLMQSNNAVAGIDLLLIHPDLSNQAYGVTASTLASTSLPEHPSKLFTLKIPLLSRSTKSESDKIQTTISNTSLIPSLVAWPPVPSSLSETIASPGAFSFYTTPLASILGFSMSPFFVLLSPIDFLINLSQKKELLSTLAVLKDFAVGHIPPFNIPGRSAIQVRKLLVGLLRSTLKVYFKRLLASLERAKLERIRLRRELVLRASCAQVLKLDSDTEDEEDLNLEGQIKERVNVRCDEVNAINVSASESPNKLPCMESGSATSVNEDAPATTTQEATNDEKHEIVHFDITSQNSDENAGSSLHDTISFYNDSPLKTIASSVAQSNIIDDLNNNIDEAEAEDIAKEKEAMKHSPQVFGFISSCLELSHSLPSISTFVVESILVPLTACAREYERLVLYSIDHCALKSSIPLYKMMQSPLLSSSLLREYNEALDECALKLRLGKNLEETELTSLKKFGLFTVDEEEKDFLEASGLTRWASPFWYGAEDIIRKFVLSLDNRNYEERTENSEGEEDKSYVLPPLLGTYLRLCRRVSGIIISLDATTLDINRVLKHICAPHRILTAATHIHLTALRSVQEPLQNLMLDALINLIHLKQKRKKALHSATEDADNRSDNYISTALISVRRLVTFCNNIACGKRFPMVGSSPNPIAPSMNSLPMLIQSITNSVHDNQIKSLFHQSKLFFSSSENIGGIDDYHEDNNEHNAIVESHLNLLEQIPLISIMMAIAPVATCGFIESIFLDDYSMASLTGIAGEGGALGINHAVAFSRLHSALFAGQNHKATANEKNLSSSADEQCSSVIFALQHLTSDSELLLMEVKNRCLDALAVAATLSATSYNVILNETEFKNAVLRLSLASCEARPIGVCQLSPDKLLLSLLGSCLVSSLDGEIPHIVVNIKNMPVHSVIEWLTSVLMDAGVFPALCFVLAIGKRWNSLISFIHASLYPAESNLPLDSMSDTTSLSPHVNPNIMDETFSAAISGIPFSSSDVSPIPPSLILLKSILVSPCELSSVNIQPEFPALIAAGFFPHHLEANSHYKKFFVKADAVMIVLELIKNIPAISQCPLTPIKSKSNTTISFFDPKAYVVGLVCLGIKLGLLSNLSDLNQINETKPSSYLNNEEEINIFSDDPILEGIATALPALSGCAHLARMMINGFLGDLRTPSNHIVALSKVGLAHLSAVQLALLIEELRQVHLNGTLEARLALGQEYGREKTFESCRSRQLNSYISSNNIVNSSCFDTSKEISLDEDNHPLSFAARLFRTGFVVEGAGFWREVAVQKNFCPCLVLVLENGGELAAAVSVLSGRFADIILWLETEVNETLNSNLDLQALDELLTFKWMVFPLHINGVPDALLLGLSHLRFSDAFCERCHQVIPRALLNDLWFSALSHIISSHQKSRTMFANDSFKSKFLSSCLRHMELLVNHLAGSLLASNLGLGQRLINNMAIADVRTMIVGLLDMQEDIKDIRASSAGVLEADIEILTKRRSNALKAAVCTIASPPGLPINEMACLLCGKNLLDQAPPLPLTSLLQNGNIDSLNETLHLSFPLIALPCGHVFHQNCCSIKTAGKTAWTPNRDSLSEEIRSLANHLKEIIREGSGVEASGCNVIVGGTTLENKMVSCPLCSSEV